MCHIHAVNNKNISLCIYTWRAERAYQLSRLHDFSIYIYIYKCKNHSNADVGIHHAESSGNKKLL